MTSWIRGVAVLTTIAAMSAGCTSAELRHAGGSSNEVRASHAASSFNTPGSGASGQTLVTLEPQFGSRAVTVEVKGGWVWIDITCRGGSSIVVSAEGATEGTFPCGDNAADSLQGADFELASDLAMLVSVEPQDPEVEWSLHLGTGRRD